ncbi:MAG TPA: hypothetical protein VGT41_02980 [Candidatus Babeliales bacterium]|nr:hypothetical protein [Candidatus Babeliales bacterium]
MKWSIMKLRLLFLMPLLLCMYISAANDEEVKDSPEFLSDRLLFIMPHPLIYAGEYDYHSDAVPFKPHEVLIYIGTIPSKEINGGQSKIQNNSPKRPQPPKSPRPDHMPIQANNYPAKERLQVPHLSSLCGFIPLHYLQHKKEGDVINIDIQNTIVSVICTNKVAYYNYNQPPKESFSEKIGRLHKQFMQTPTYYKDQEQTLLKYAIIKRRRKKGMEHGPNGIAFSPKLSPQISPRLSQLLPIN